MKLKVFKRVLAIVMSLTLLVGSAPTFAIATEEENFDGIVFKNTGHFERQEGGLVNFVYEDSDVLIPEKSNNRKKAISLPDEYDLRDVNGKSYVTPIKDQGITGTCWTFAVMNAMESNTIKQGNATSKNIDLSERQLAWYTYKGENTDEDRSKYAGGDTYVPSYSGDDYDEYKEYYGNVATGYGINFNELYTYYQGGSSYTAIPTLARNYGASAESKCAFESKKAYTSDYEIVTLQGLMGAPADGTQTIQDIALKEAHILPEFYSSSDTTHSTPLSDTITAVKEALYNTGAVTVNYNANGDGRETNSGDYTYYYDYYDDSNHAVSIVGWDDNYSKRNFKGEVNSGTPKGNGAWIIKNSWDTDWGDDGYFYLSYYDKSIDGATVYITEDKEYGTEGTKYDNVYQYDASMMPMFWTTSDGKSANIFTARSKEVLSALSFSTDSADTTVQLQVYKDLEDNDDPESGTQVLNKTVNVSNAGFYTCELSDAEKTILTKGSKYSTIISEKYTSSGNTYYNLANETDIYSGTSKYYTVDAKEGESFVYANGTWKDATDVIKTSSGKKYNVGGALVKAYTNKTSAHILTKVSAGESATCTANGESPYWQCQDNDCGCEKYYSDANGTDEITNLEEWKKEVGKGIIKALGHSFTNYASDGNATCLADGTKTAKCDRCTVTNTVTDEGSKKKHTFANYEYNDNATCMKNGTKTGHCTTVGCDATDEIEAEGTQLPHKYEGDYTYNNDATCTENGTQTRYCKNQGCTASETIEAPNTAKNHENSITNTQKEEPATCTNTGTKAYCYCSACQKYYEYDNETVGTVIGSASELKTWKSTTGKGKIAKDTVNGHSYGTASYSWSGSKCTGTATCSSCRSSTSNHTISETVTGTYQKDSDATCIADEKGHYLATFTKVALGTATNSVTGETTKESVQALHKSNEYYDYEPEEPATCINTGTKAYCECTECGIYWEDNGDEDNHVIGNVIGNNIDTWLSGDGLIKKDTSVNGHSYGEATYELSTDKKVCTATMVCNACDENVANHTSNVKSEEVEYKMTSPATCVSIEKGIYAATFEDENLNHNEEVAIGEIDTSVNGHTYDTPAYSWSEDKTSCTATATCSLCPEETVNKTISETATIDEETVIYQKDSDATCTINETGHHEATFSYDTIFENQTTGKDSIEKSGTACHKWNDGEISTPATCSSTGVKTYKCTVSDCQGEKTEEIPVDENAHSIEILPKVEPTCTQTGLTEGSRCSLCGDTIKPQETISANGHTWNSGEITKSATCSSTGVRTYKCTVSDCQGEKTEEIPVREHKWGEGIVIKEATTTEDGEILYTCTYEDCKQTKTESIPKIVHKFDKITKGANPTCTVDGYESYWKCTHCSNYFEDNNGTAGTEIGNADDLEYWKKNEGKKAKTGHTPVVGTAVIATCCSEGKTAGIYCSVCKATIEAQQTVDKNTSNHAGGSEVRNAREATCTQEGYTGDTYCKGCNSKTASGTATPMVAHTAVADPAVSATCTAGGKTAGSHCSVCNTVLKAQTATPAIGHKWSVAKVSTKATATKNGKTVSTCSRCNSKQEKAITKSNTKISPTTKKFKKTALASSNKTFKISVTNAKGGVSYSSNNKKVTVNSNGKVTVKKGITKDTYKITVTVKATTNYAKVTGTVKVKIT